VLAAASPSDVDAVCTEGVWTGTRISVDLLSSTDGGTRFGPSHTVPVGSADLAAATGTSTVVVAATTNGATSVGVTLETTSDDGASWRSVFHKAGQGWLDLAFTATGEGVAIVLRAGGRANAMLLSSDGGMVWTPVHFA